VVLRDDGVMSVGMTVLALWVPRLADRVGGWRPAVSEAGLDDAHVTMRPVDTQLGANQPGFTGSLFIWLNADDRFRKPGAAPALPVGDAPARPPQSVTHLG
jgi:hypothetical protein